MDRFYVNELPKTSRLVQEDLEKVILDQAMRCYDNASNGNRTRGSMKKASDMYVHVRMPLCQVMLREEQNQYIPPKLSHQQSLQLCRCSYHGHPLPIFLLSNTAAWRTVPTRQHPG